MSVDKAFRAMIRNEIQSQLRPLQQAVAQLQAGAGDWNSLRDLANRLAPLSGLFGSAAPRRGRPPGSGRKLGVRAKAQNGANDRPCALIGCKRDARSKGYCAAHYQKYRNLQRSNRLPAEWVEHAPPNSVKDLVLPRGRAAAKAKAAGKRN